MEMQGRQPDLFFLKGVLLAEVVFAVIEEGKGIAGAVERREIQLVEAGVAEWSFALLKDVRTMGVEGQLLLHGLDAIESIFKLGENVELLEERRHELGVFLLSGRRGCRGICRRFVGTFSHGAGSWASDTNVVARVIDSREEGSSPPCSTLVD
jgi:hypothetical protein